MEEKKQNEIRVILSNKKLGELDDEQVDLYRRMASALSFAYGRDVSLPEARAKLDFLVELDQKRAELEERCVILREDALGSYEIARKQLSKDPKYKEAMQRGVDRSREFLDEFMTDPKKSILKITFFDETRKLDKEEAIASDVPEESTLFTGIRIIMIVLDSGERKII